MNQEYFSVALSSDINLAIPLDNMGTAIQVETKNICVIPGVAEFWYGAVNFKGSLLWVLDSNRYFNLNHKQDRYQKKLTAVIIKKNQADDSQKLALIALKLQGIVALESEQLELLSSNNSESSLQKCCSAIAERQTKRTFILNPASLLEQLHQQHVLTTPA